MDINQLEINLLNKNVIKFGPLSLRTLFFKIVLWF